MRLGRLSNAWLLIAATVALQGCGSLRDDLVFKSEARSALGKNVEEAWKKVEPLKPIEAARSNYVALHERRLADIDNYQANLQASLQAQLAAGYGTPLMKQLAALQGQIGFENLSAYCSRPQTPADPYCMLWDPAEISGLKAVAQAVAGNEPREKIMALQAGIPKRFAMTFQDSLVAKAEADTAWKELAALAARSGGGKLPSCVVWNEKDSPDESKPSSGQVARKLWADRAAKNPVLRADLYDGKVNVGGVCSAVAAADASLRRAIGNGSPIFTQMAKVEGGQSALDAKRAAAQAAKAQVEAEQDKAGDEKASALDGIKKSFASLDASVKKLTALAEAVSPKNEFAKEALLELKRESLTAFFKAVKDAEPGKPPPEGGGRVATALILFANFSDKTDERLAAAESVGMEAIALKEQLTKLEQQRVQREIAVLEQNQKLEQARLDAMIAQLDAYIKADAFVQAFGFDYLASAESSKLDLRNLSLQSALLGKATVECPQCKKGAAVSVEISPELRSQLLQGIAGYLQAGVTYAPLFHKLDAQATVLSQAGRMDAAEVTVQTWSAVLSSNVQQLSTWASFGLTKDDFQKGLNNLFTGLIAIKVLK